MPGHLNRSRAASISGGKRLDANARSGSHLVSGDDSADYADRDVNDQALLLGGNKYPPEYYLKSLGQFDDSEFSSEDYSPGTTLLLDRIEEQWNQSVHFILVCSHSGPNVLPYL